MFSIKRLAILITAGFFFSHPIHLLAQPPSSTDIANAKEMLRMVALDVNENYFDPNQLKEFGFSARAAATEKQLNEAQSVSHLYAMISQIFLDFDQQWNFFLSPMALSNPIDYGIDWQLIGNDCLITYVVPESDAAKQGLAGGERIITINGWVPNRKTFSPIEHALSTASPQAVLRMRIADLSGEEKDIAIKSKRRFGKGVIESTDWEGWYKKNSPKTKLKHFVKVTNDIGVWRLAYSSEVWTNPGDALKFQSLIIDARGCCLLDELQPLKAILQKLLLRDAKIADLRTRKGIKPVLVKSDKEKAFQGKLIVIIDSQSYLLGELLAKTLQREQRATVIGDQSKGHFRLTQGFEHVIERGPAISLVFMGYVTHSEILTAEGQSLEKIGVKPDVIVLPSPTEFPAQDDSVLARAIEMLGGKITPSEAGKLWPPYFRVW